MSRITLRLLCVLGGVGLTLACQLESAPTPPAPAPAHTPAPAPAPAKPQDAPLENTLSGEPPPAEVLPFVPPGFKVLDVGKSDLDEDGQEDMVVALGKIEPPPADEDDRPLLILLRKGGALELARRADHVILCSSCGGVMGDPLQGVVASKGKFEVMHLGGSSDRWTLNYTFAYDPQKRDWFLDGETASHFSSFDPEETLRSKRIPRAELGDIAVSDFRHPDRTSQKWRVTAKKTYFYDQPERGSQPRKAYLVEGDTVDGSRELVNFVWASFTNGEGQSTDGFLLKKELSPLPN